MTKKHAPKNRPRHSRTNGRPPNPRYVDYVFPGYHFSWMGAFELEVVETVEFRVPRKRGHIAAWMYPAILSLAGYRSDCDAYLMELSSVVGLSTELFVERNMYATPDGWAQTHLDHENSRLRVVSGFVDPADAGNAMTSWQLESDRKWVDRVMTHLSEVEMQHDVLEGILSMALRNRQNWLKIVGDPSLLLPFVRRELKVNDEQNLDEVISKSITTFQKVFRSRR